MSLNPQYLQRFKKRQGEDSRYWPRFQGKPDFQNAKVLEVGCGTGSLCMDIALSGARKVVGLDLSSSKIAFANQNVQENFPHLTNILEYVDCRLEDYPEDGFDYMVSRNTFEHVMGLDQLLQAMKQRLKVGGRIYTGFGPLYNSPLGDHSRTKTLFPYGPWGYLLLSEAQIVKRLNERYNQNIMSIYDLGLNKLAFADYLRIFNESGMKIVYFRLNQPKSSKLSARLIGQVCSLLRLLPGMREYFTFNIYCILEKTSE